MIIEATQEQKKQVRLTHVVNCGNCNITFLTVYKKYCSRKCQNTRNARVRRQKRCTIIYLTKCLRCNISIQKPKRTFCSPSCKNIYNHKIKYGYKYSILQSSKSPENFIGDLLNKKIRKHLKVFQENVFEIYHKQKGLCAISGMPMTYIRGAGEVLTNISIDKIDSSKGYTLDNIQFVCRIVNTMKWTMNKEQLLIWCKTIVLHNQDK